MLKIKLKISTFSHLTNGMHMLIYIYIHLELFYSLKKQSLCFNCLGSFKSCVSKIILGLKASYDVNNDDGTIFPGVCQPDCRIFPRTSARWR